ncbi:hypothetical protein BDK51DRAFT_42408 [Blyttiomyces helicus]|uniref:Uncharacterized protein n=1 Tax=Blyttiomyces helicus TaxID=388810 RepID=A0A4P9WTS1_9FUNG|nr:hypothetical protein BDK51DRAFT_42408 [Blyttiomyces helicus]|eukprot:RKO94486.1 hypothetical protein BDK51DRAFT_42408 [Blyttiomyces helicus]
MTAWEFRVHSITASFTRTLFIPIVVARGRSAYYDDAYVSYRLSLQPDALSLVRTESPAVGTCTWYDTVTVGHATGPVGGLNPQTYYPSEPSSPGGTPFGNLRVNASAPPPLNPFANTPPSLSPWAQATPDLSYDPEMAQGVLFQLGQLNIDKWAIFRPP